MLDFIYRLVVIVLFLSVAIVSAEFAVSRCADLHGKNVLQLIDRICTETRHRLRMSHFEQSQGLS